MKKQLIILWIGIGLVVLAILFPPWMVNSGGTRKFLGYGFLFSSSRELASFSSIESSRLTAEILIIVVLTAGVFYTAKIFPSSFTLSQKMRKGLKFVVAGAVVVGVVTFAGVLLVDRIHLQAKKAQPIAGSRANALQQRRLRLKIIDGQAVVEQQSNELRAIGNQPEITTALHYAADQGNLSAIERCLQQGVTVDARNREGMTPLMYAVSSSKGKLPVMYAASNSIDELLKVIKYLIVKGADVNAKDEGGRTPLMHATQAGCLDIVKYLIIEGADVNAKDNYNGTPLLRAAWNGHLDVVAYLITKGADVNARDGYGNTPLNRAAEYGYRDVATLLKQHGAKE